MMQFLQRVFRRVGGQREEDARNLLYDLKQRTQELEAERFFCHQSRMRANRYEWMIDRIRQGESPLLPRPDERVGERP